MVGDLVALGPGRTSRSRSRHAVPSKGLGCGSSSILDRASVVILVTSEGCSASEGLLAISVRALVWPLARMDTAVPGQRAGVAKWL